MQGITQKITIRLASAVIVAAIASVVAPLVFNSSASAAATATWNNKTGTISFNGRTYVQRPVQLGISVGSSGATFETQKEVNGLGSSGGFSPSTKCPTTMIIVSGSLASAKTAKYYSGGSSGVQGCEFSSSSNIAFINTYTYQDPAAGTDITSKLNSTDQQSAADLANCEATSDGYQPDLATCCQTTAYATAHADTCAKYTCNSGEQCDLVAKYINPVIKFLSALAILAVIIGVIWGAIQYITSGGDAQKVAEGKGKIQKALFGLLAFVFLYALLNWLIPGGL